MKELTVQTTESASRQNLLGAKGLFGYIVLMNMFIPLSTDLYLPALPTMSVFFGCSASTVNLTLSSFFFFYAFGLLIWGTLSDKYGRKKVILVSSVIFTISSSACALVPNVYALIMIRALHGFGAGGILAASMAIIKDCYQGKKRATMLAATQTASGIAPMAAPVIGAWMMKFTSWQGTFWLLAAICAVNIILTVLYKETLKDEERYTGRVSGALTRLVSIGKNKGLLIPTLLFSTSMIPLMGYIAMSSYIYVDYFGLSEQIYSYFFALNALVMMFGPVVYLRFFSNFNRKTYPVLCHGIAAAAGVALMVFGDRSPLCFLLFIMVMSLSTTMFRPFSSYILFEQQQGDSGGVSSIINTSFTVFGSLGTVIASLAWGNMILSLGSIITVSCLAAIIGWFFFLYSSIPCIGVKEAHLNPTRQTS